MEQAKPKKLPAAFYRNAAGNEPVRAWLKRLPPDDRKAIGIDIATVEFGWPVGMPACRPIASRKGIWEVRSDIGDGRIARILFCIHGGRMMLLHGFIKKSQKTPAREIDTAVKRKKEIEQ
jgi:phage-related protein